MKGGSSIKHKKMLLVLLAGPPVLLALLYAGGYLAQFIANYNAWKQAGADKNAEHAIRRGKY